MIIKYIFINIAYIWRAIAPKCSVVIAFRGCKTNFVDEDVRRRKNQRKLQNYTSNKLALCR